MCIQHPPHLARHRRRLELEPWQEEAHCTLMRLLALKGERSAALGQYETCKRVLKSELSAEPGVETLRLYESIRGEEMGVPRAERAKMHNLPVFYTQPWCSCGAVGKDGMEKVENIDILTARYGG